MNTPRVILLPRRAQPFFARHPWVFTGAIDRLDGLPRDGEEVDLASSAGSFVARGCYNGRSKIRVRLYCWEPERQLDDDFFRDRINTAQRFRQAVFGEQNAYRLLSSEGDFLSGLIVDRYDQWLTVQFTSLALGQRRDRIIPILAELTGVKGVYLRTERGIGQLEGLELHDGPVWGEPPTGPVEIVEGAVRYRVDVREGQKTGFFLDQRANRRRVADFLADREVLDCFCYTGGFGLHAAKHGAKSVEGVDISEPALKLARENADLNGVKNASWIKSDVFEYLGKQVPAGRRYDAIILDPPKFARTRKSKPEALRGYRSLLGQSLKLLRTDGILVMCCCSGLITGTEIEEIIAQVAVDNRRGVQILERRGQDIDHPINAACPQTSYLKCFICRVI